MFAYISLLQQDWFFYLNLIIGGLLAGSFCTTLIYRLPIIAEGDSKHNLSLSFPASHCPECKKTISWFYNLPLLGYLLTRGRCASCSCQIAWFYPVTEMLCVFAALLAGWLFGPDIVVIPILLLLWSLIALSIIDIRSGLLPDLLTLALLWLGILLNPLMPYAELTQAVWGAALGYIFLTAVNFIYYLLRRRVGIGGGDIKLFAALGSYFGWQSLLPILLISSISGIMFFILHSVFIGGIGKNGLLKPQIWGPHIALAAIFYLLLFHRWQFILQPFLFHNL